jgi:cytochrome c-type protein NapB
MRSYSKFSIAALIALGLIGIAVAGRAVEDDKIGLSKTSVFATPDPVIAGSSAGEPGENETQAAYFHGAPPLVPHQVKDFLPITLTENYCQECHDLKGQEPSEGAATPLPASHYIDLRSGSDKPSPKVTGSRYLCDLCHVQPLDAQPLVPNTYRQ